MVGAVGEEDKDERDGKVGGKSEEQRKRENLKQLLAQGKEDMKSLGEKVRYILTLVIISI